jgi:FKBP-type peptidyl-prolyl cis-trans isomerase FkpA
MAEVTRVPLQPVSRQSLLMLFLGIVIGLAIAGAVAWWMQPKGVSIETVQAGTGDSPDAEDVVFVHYTGRLADGTVFDQSQDTQLPIEGILPQGTPFPLQGVFPGFREAAMRMQRGGRYVVEIPADKAYGESPPPGSPIPPNADLTFEIELVDFMPMAEAEQRIQRLQQAMMQQMQQEGAEGQTAPQPAE